MSKISTTLCAVNWYLKNKEVLARIFVCSVYVVFVVVESEKITTVYKYLTT